MLYEKLPPKIADILLNEKFSQSERRGLGLVSPSDRIIYSPGISTGGVAEVKMSLSGDDRLIIATSIDQAGIEGMESIIDNAGLNEKIKVKNEDVSMSLPYKDEYFDFIYARLLLHYLPKQDLNKSLSELFRVMKKDHKMFVVVRSVDDPESKLPGAKYDKETGLTTYPLVNSRGEKSWIKRYFHSKESISSHLTEAGFNVADIQQHNEQLYQDFSRTLVSPFVSNVIEVVAEKPST